MKKLLHILLAAAAVIILSSCFMISASADEAEGIYTSAGKFTEITVGKVLPVSVYDWYSEEEIPSWEIRWVSSDEDIATVDGDGWIYAHHAGTAWITAITDSGQQTSILVRTLFTDVNGSPVKGDWDYQYYYNAVYWAVDNNISTGYDRIYFAPDLEFPRRYVLIFLWKLAGSPVADEYGNPYPNAKDIFWDLYEYSYDGTTVKAISWGVAEGITKGFNDGGFHPDDSINRKDCMILLYRMAGRPYTEGYVTYRDIIDLGYSEGSDTVRSIVWAEKNGITGGYSDGTFRPFDETLREHVITFLYRYNNLWYDGYGLTDQLASGYTYTYIELPYDEELGMQVVDEAMSYVGVMPYVWAGSSLETGTDCSGFVSQIYSHYGIYLPRSSDEYQYLDNQISYDQLKPGDVVVYWYGGHVGIYAGNDMLIHAANEEEGTIYGDMWFAIPTAYIRVLPE